jgi:hypothetical protein
VPTSGEKKAQLLERHSRDLVLGEVVVDEFGKREPSPDAALAPELLQYALRPFAALVAKLRRRSSSTRTSTART